VLKLGGSVLRGERDLPRAVSEVYRIWRRGARVVAVVSALGPTTDELLRRAEQLGLPPRGAAFAAYLGGGEHAAASLLALALQKSGLPASLLDAAGAGLVTTGDPHDAEPVALDAGRLLASLGEGGIAVLPGFVGRDASGQPTLLGRGGSDLTALFVAAELGGACVLVKDVGGVFTADPARADLAPRRYASIGWESARAVAGGAVQDKALRFAAARGLAFTVRAPGAPLDAAGAGTRVGSGPDRLAGEGASDPVPPLRVALLGCGAVGGGVLRHLLARPESFLLVGVAVRDPRRAAPEVPRHLLCTPEELLGAPAEVFVEAAGGLGVEPWARRVLESGRHLVTANKALLAESGPALQELAAARGVRLLSSAAVGGALPALETVARVARRPGVRALRAVLNGTSTFVLGRLAQGDTLEEAAAEARRRGFAEADPRLDLDGTDAAQKLTLLLREAFSGATLPEVERRGIDAALVSRVRRGAGSRPGVWRLVASARRAHGRVQARVRPERLLPGDFLATTEEAGNALELVLGNGELLRVRAQGAGRWPTAEAVLADLDDLRLLRARVTLETEVKAVEVR
jgi:homoserine dehydrogenase